MSEMFYKKLTDMLNKESAENESNTPDFILAQFLLGCLRAFNQATQQRETWYGRDARPTLHGSQEEIAKSMRNAWRDCCDCTHEGEIGTTSCHECFDDPARPQWDSKKQLQPDPWGAWVEKMPKRIEEHYKCESSKIISYEKKWDEWENEMRNWFREMPRGKG